jgi:hypothetical protein
MNTVWSHDVDEVFGTHNRGRRLDAQPAAEVLARIDVVVDARSLDLWDTAACFQGQAISGPGGLA